MSMPPSHGLTSSYMIVPSSHFIWYELASLILSSVNVPHSHLIWYGRSSFSLIQHEHACLTSSDIKFSPPIVSPHLTWACFFLTSSDMSELLSHLIWHERASVSPHLTWARSCLTSSDMSNEQASVSPHLTWAWQYFCQSRDIFRFALESFVWLREEWKGIELESELRSSRRSESLSPIEQKTQSCRPLFEKKNKRT